MADRTRDELLEQEIRELTDLFRHDDSFARLRQIMADRGLIASDAILAGLIEGEDDSSYGVVLTPTGVCMVFEADRDDSPTRWERVDDITSLEHDFAAVAVAVSMQRLGLIS